MKYLETVTEMLFPNKFKHIIVIIVILVLTVTNVLTHQIASNAIDQSKMNASKIVPYKEYYMEHNVSQSDARQQFFEYGIKLIDGV